MILFPALILPLSGNFLWVEGWVFSIWFDAMMLANWIYLYTKNPSLIEERLNKHGYQNQKKWDKYLLRSLFILSFSWITIMPLDAQQFHLSPDFPFFIKTIGFTLLVPAFYFCIRPTMDNPYLSTVVRIQDDRKQKVIESGAYGFVRHPQYLGILLLIIGGPLFLNSIFGLILGICIAMLFVVRIIGEEKMLSEELDGYVEYKQKVKYRLIPLIW